VRYHIRILDAQKRLREQCMKVCIYCGCEKPDEEFSDEHIWPDALGGDFLPRDVWRTDDVCQKCNSISGVFVDGAFIRSWIGQAERSSDSHEYLVGRGKPAAIPLHYLGPIKDVPLPAGHVADFWAGPCGANIVHIRPDDGDEQWTTYAGGDPRGKKSKAGRAYMALTSEDEFWIAVSLLSFHRHFDRAERFVVNMGIPANWPFKEPDRFDAVQAEDMKVVDAVTGASRTGKQIHLQPVISVDVGNRMLAKLGLAVGYKLLGAAFLETEHGKNLRAGMREAKFEKRQDIAVRGSGLFGQAGLEAAKDVLAWPGGWVLLVSVVQGKLFLGVVVPSGKSMTVLISDEAALVATVDPTYKDGAIWITVPAAGEAVGPILLPEYLAHQTGMSALPALTTLASKRGDRKKLPPCRPTDDPTASSAVLE